MTLLINVDAKVTQYFIISVESVNDEMVMFS